MQFLSTSDALRLQVVVRRLRYGMNRRPNPRVILSIQANFDQADDTTLALGSFSEAVHPANGDHRERSRRVFLSNSLFEGVLVFHVAVVRQEYHPLRLCKPPYGPVTTVHWEANLYKRDQSEGTDLQPAFRCQGSPEEQDLPCNIMINKDRVHTILSLAFAACNLARISSCPGLGGLSATCLWHAQFRSSQY